MLRAILEYALLVASIFAMAATAQSFNLARKWDYASPDMATCGMWALVWLVLTAIYLFVRRF